MKRIALLLAFLAGSAGAETGGFDHSSLDGVLKHFVNERGLVDYASLKARPDELNAYVDRLGRVSPVSHPGRFPSRDDRLAYWINAYNAFVLKGVADAYPVESVKEIKMLSGFFNRTYFVAGEERYTLNKIEHGILREEFDEPRIHAAINCASIGCPRLLREAFAPGRLEAQLESAMRSFVREARNMRTDRGKAVVYLSAIFDWFKEDFTGWYARTHKKKNVRITDYLKLYASDEDRLYLEQHPDIGVKYVDYDWTLNDQALAKR